VKSSSSPLLSRAVLAVTVGIMSCGGGTSDTNGAENPQGPALEPGEICDASNRPPLVWYVDAPIYRNAGDPSGDVTPPHDSPPNTQAPDAPPAPQPSVVNGTIVVAPGQTRPIRIIVEPDFCDPAKATFTTSNAGVVAAPTDAKLDLRHATIELAVTGLAKGTAKITAAIPTVDHSSGPAGVRLLNTLDINIEVRDNNPPTCDAGETAGSTIGSDGCDGAACKLRGPKAPPPKPPNPGAPNAPDHHLENAYLSIPQNAFVRTDEFALEKFPATVSCGGDLVSTFQTPLVALGPAVSFTGAAPFTMGKPMRRDVEVAIPVNPAIFAAPARLRHLVVLYKGPRVKTARPIPIASPRIEKDGDDYVLKFQTPWLGTFQAAVKSDAGTLVNRRHLTHRAVIGFSMGGGGAAVFGMRHHDKFDAIAPLGGPSDWTWLLWYIESFALGGFCPAGKTCPTIAPNRYTLDEPYAHTMDYEHWFYQEGNGNGGHFPRSEYVQIFEDLALSMGNPNGSRPELPQVALGPMPNDPWIVGDPSIGLPPGVDCSFTVDPISNDPNEQRQKDIETKCKVWRCDPAHQWVAKTGYYDDEYNPDGSLPVSTFCDGGQQGDSPYVNTWQPGGDKPVNLGLFVDLNKNGIRDKGEPIIRSGHESYDDCGPDGLCDELEPGYNPDTNPDPNQDDYDYTLNPNGTEGNHRWDPGEPYRDFGLDGVADTATKSAVPDVGENDGKFTQAFGLENFYSNDPHGIVARRVANVPGGIFTDDALRRLDILSDGGVRDLFNFAVVASHFQGQLFARTGADGLPIRSAAFYNGFQTLPGQSAKESDFAPGSIRWADVADLPSVRYGDIDATAQQISNGDGQHVGTVGQLLARLEMAFFYVGKRWPDADHRLTFESRDQPATKTYDASLYANPPVPQPDDLDAGKQLDCEINGRCEHMFTGPSTRRVGPIAVSLPPGYAHEANVDRQTRYPVLYVLHGYGQDPRDLEAVAIFTNNFMNVAQRSYATRLAKFIIVYVDGRCRVRADGKPECIRGTFYMDSQRPDGAKMDAWFDEVVDFVDKRYRTMGPADADAVE
jgi:hypothetical protein